MNTIKGRRAENDEVAFAVETLESRRMLAVFQASDFASIQAALDAAAAAPGADTVSIGRGTFSENLVIQDQGPLTIRGVGGTGGTYIDGITGITIDILNSPDVEVRNVAVQGGTIGIRSAGVGTLNLQNVRALSHTMHGLHIVSTESVIINRGRFDDNLQNGALVDSASTVSITNTSMSNNGNDGLQIGSSVVNTINISGGSYVGNADDGVDVKAEIVQIVRVRSTDNAEDGIQVSDSSSVMLTSVSVERNRDGGIDLDDLGTVVVVNARALDNGSIERKDGLDARNVVDLTISRGMYANNTGNGIDLNDIGAGHIISTSARDNGKNGVELSSANSLEISRGNYSNNGRRGLDLDGESGNLVGTTLIDRVTASGNSGSGMEVNFTDTLIVLAGRFQKNGGNGIKVETSNTIQIDRTNASLNTQDGLLVLGDPTTQLTVTRGVYSRNLEDGIDVRNVGMVLVDSARGGANGDDGLEVLNAITVEIPNVRFTGSGDDDVSII